MAGEAGRPRTRWRVGIVAAREPVARRPSLEPRIDRCRGRSREGPSSGAVVSAGRPFAFQMSVAWRRLVERVLPRYVTAKLARHHCREEVYLQ